MNKPDKEIDPILNELAKKIEPINDSIAENPDLGLFCIGVKNVGDETTGGVQTFVNIAGSGGVIAEGLYNELADQIERGELGFFSLLAEVIHDLEDDYGTDNMIEDESSPDEGDEITFH